MFAKKEWFEKRKYGGWGVHPRTWQGWVYIFIMVASLGILQALPFWNVEFRVGVLLAWFVVFGIDIFTVMIKLRKDEMEQKLEAIAERNASWVMMGVITIGLVYQMISSGLEENFQVDWFLAAALILGAVVKGISYYIMEKKGLN